MSDLHVDVCAYTPAPTPPGTDVVIVAGDVCNRLHDRALPWLREHLLPRGLPVIYVPGNHDFYRVHDTRIVSNPRGNIYTVGQGKRATVVVVVVVVENVRHDPAFTVEV